MPASIVNVADAVFIELAEFSQRFGSPPPPERFGGRIAFLSRELGAQKLGYNLTELEPGKSAFPFHSHRANEELFFILEGEGVLRLGAQRHAIRSGDLIACPPGGPETAHQIVNTGQARLRFLAVSTALTPEVCQYPDSRKLGILDPAAQYRHLAADGASLGYWDGE